MTIAKQTLDGFVFYTSGDPTAQGSLGKFHDELRTDVLSSFTNQL
jgi:hypothetical protein